MFCWNRWACADVEPAMKRRFACGVAGLVAVVALATGCATLTARSGLGTATCGSVSTNDFSGATRLYQTDAGAVPCLARALTKCRSESLDVWQTGVDSGSVYRLTITGSATDGCKVRRVESTYVAPNPARRPASIPPDCIARKQDTNVLIACSDGTYLLPPDVASPQPTLPESSPPANTPRPTPPPSAPSPTPERTFPPQPSEGPNGYPTGEGAQVVAVGADAAGHPLITLLIPNMNCAAMYFDIPAIPAPNGRPCVVTFHAGTGQVGPADATTTNPGASCPAWPTPQVTFVVDPLPTAGCTADATPVAGLHPGAIGWLVEGGGLPYFALANGTEFRPPARQIATHVTPSVAATP